MSPRGNRKFASRLNQLGTETAYAVSDEARKAKASGKKVYDFHIGDLNFGSSPAVVEATKKALDDGKTGYCSAQGIVELRDAVAAQTSKERNVTYDATNVCIQPGGKPVIMKFLLAVMEEGDEVLYPNPGYPIYESLIRFLGGIPKPYTFSDTKDGFVLDMEFFKSQITSKTKVFIYNNLQNPTGHMSSGAEMKELARLACEHDWWVLSDEPYFKIVYGKEHGESIVSLEGMKERTVLLLTASKCYGMTGWRLGAAVGPSDVIQVITKLATNDEGCTNHFVQCGSVAAYADLNGRSHAFTANVMKELEKRRDLLVSLLNDIPGFSAHIPPSTFYLFVDATDAFHLLGCNEYEVFRRKLLHETGVSVCTREHFGPSLPGETRKYVRFAFSGITCDLITEACGLLKAHERVV